MAGAICSVQDTKNIHSAAVSKLTTIIARTEAGADNGGRRR